MSQLPPKPQFETKQSSGGKVLLGCGAIGCGFMLLLCSGIAIAAYFGFGKLTEYSNEFVAKGYAAEGGQVVQVTQSPEKPTVYTCQVLRITTDVDVDLAAFCQVMDVQGRVNGDIDFFGQVLNIKKGSVVTGDIRVRKGQVINIEGTVLGKVTGSYQVLKGNIPKPQAESVPESDTELKKAPPSFEIPLDDPPRQPANTGESLPDASADEPAARAAEPAQREPPEGAEPAESPPAAAETPPAE